jgi:hypothetical protein
LPGSGFHDFVQRCTLRALYQTDYVGSLVGTLRFWFAPLGRGWLLCSLASLARFALVWLPGVRGRRAVLDCFVAHRFSFPLFVVVTFIAPLWRNSKHNLSGRRGWRVV